MQALANLINNIKNPDITAIEALATAGTEMGNNPKYRQMFEKQQTPSKKDIQAFTNWYQGIRQQMPYLQENPVGGNYNYYGFWKALMTPNSGVATGINPNDNMVHFSDTYLNKRGESMPLKAPWHPNKWTTPAWELYNKGIFTNQDLQEVNDWNAQRLGVPRNYGGM